MYMHANDIIFNNSNNMNIIVFIIHTNKICIADNNPVELSCLMKCL